MFNHNRRNGFHDGHNGNDTFFIVSIVVKEKQDYVASFAKPFATLAVKNKN